MTDGTWSDVSSGRLAYGTGCTVGVDQRGLREGAAGGVQLDPSINRTSTNETSTLTGFAVIKNAACSDTVEVALAIPTAGESFVA